MNCLFFHLVLYIIPVVLYNFITVASITCWWIKVAHYSAPQTLSLDLTGPTSKGNGGRGKKERAREGRGGERKGRNGKGTHSGLDLVPLLFCGSTPMMMMNYISCYSHKNIITPIYFMLFVVVGIYHAWSTYPNLVLFNICMAEWLSRVSLTIVKDVLCERPCRGVVGW